MLKAFSLIKKHSKSSGCMINWKRGVKKKHVVTRTSFVTHVVGEALKSTSFEKTS